MRLSFSWYKTALIIAGICVIASAALFISHLSTSQKAQKDSPIANVGDIYGEVFRLRKESESWQKLRQGHHIFQGDSLRSEKDSHAEIAFSNTADRVDLGPQSQIVLFVRNKEKRILIKAGEVFVRAAGERGSQAFNIEMLNSTLKGNSGDFFFRSQTQSSFTVDVFRGRLMHIKPEPSLLIEKDSTGRFDEKGLRQVIKNRFKSYAPHPHQYVFHSTQNSPTTRFAWTPIAKNYSVQLYLGPTPTKMRRAGSPVLSQKEELSFRVPVGTQYWRLVASSNGQGILKTAVKKIYSRIEKSTVGIQPLNGERVYTSKDNRNLLFHWQNPSRLEKLLLEISRTVDFTDIIISEPVVESGYFVMPLENDGQYFWRVNGFRRESSEVVLGSVNSFFLYQHDDPDVPPRIYPPHDGLVSSVEVASGKAYLAWETRGDTRYTVTLEGPFNNKDFSKRTWTVKGNMTPLTNLAAGRYRWSYVADSPEIKTPDLSYQFSVFPAKKLKLRLPKTIGSQIPELKGKRRVLSWSKGPRKTKKYKTYLIPYSFKDSSQRKLQKTTKNTVILVTKNNDVNLAQLSSGYYDVFVEALDTVNGILARSRTLSIKITD
jgi:hypothetical protein